MAVEERKDISVLSMFVFSLGFLFTYIAVTGAYIGLRVELSPLALIMTYSCPNTPITTSIIVCNVVM